MFSLLTLVWWRGHHVQVKSYNWCGEGHMQKKTHSRIYWTHYSTCQNVELLVVLRICDRPASLHVIFIGLFKNEHTQGAPINDTLQTELILTNAAWIPFILCHRWCNDTKPKWSNYVFGHTDMFVYPKGYYKACHCLPIFISCG